MGEIERDSSCREGASGGGAGERIARRENNLSPRGRGEGKREIRRTEREREREQEALWLSQTVTVVQVYTYNNRRCFT